jgi:hypothetical protein
MEGGVWGMIFFVKPQVVTGMPMILAANTNAQGSHVGEWRHPDTWDKPAPNIANAVRLAEAGKMGVLFLVDGKGVRQTPIKNHRGRCHGPTSRPLLICPPQVGASRPIE